MTCPPLNMKREFFNKLLSKAIDTAGARCAFIDESGKRQYFIPYLPNIEIKSQQLDDMEEAERLFLQGGAPPAPAPTVPWDARNFNNYAPPPLRMPSPERKSHPERKPSPKRPFLSEPTTPKRQRTEQVPKSNPRPNPSREERKGDDNSSLDSYLEIDEDDDLVIDEGEEEEEQIEEDAPIQAYVFKDDADFDLAEEARRLRDVHVSDRSKKD